MHQAVGVAHPEWLRTLTEITACRDTDALHVAYLRVLGGITGAHRVALYTGERVAGVGRAHPVLRLAAAQDGSQWLEEEEPGAGDDQAADVLACIEQGRLVAHRHADRHRLVLPVGAASPAHGAVVVEVPVCAVMEEASTCLQFVTHIYNDCLQLLNFGERDQLTGLLNRRTFDSRLRRVMDVERAAQARNGMLPAGAERRQGGDPRRGVWVGVLDIDHFKRVNDTYGHVIGDEVIVLLANHIRKMFRRSDLAFRFGGEEFVVVLQPCRQDHALGVFERFRTTLAERQFMQVGSITTSIGFAGLDLDGFVVEALDRADKALYFSKQNGRNQVRNFEELATAGLIADTVTTGDTELFI